MANGNGDKVRTIYQSLGILVVLFGLLAAPAKIKISAIETRIDKVEETHKEHCIDNDNKYSSAAVVEVQLRNIAIILADIKEQLKDCRQSDKEFMDKFNTYISTH